MKDVISVYFQNKLLEAVEREACISHNKVCLMTLLEKAFENLEDCRYVLSLDVCALHDDSKVVV